MRKNITVRAISTLVIAGGMLFGGVAFAAPANAKGGASGACSMMSPNARLHSGMCNPRLIKVPSITERCAKMAAAAGFLAGGGVAVTTTPFDVPGIVILGTFMAGGTLIFCEAAWL